MQELESLCREATGQGVRCGRPLDDSSKEVRLGPNATEAARQLHICNACRYCEGFCAVFPAMTRRVEFAAIDIHYLANLCHNCGACLHACQYAPPHEFAVNVPQSLARVRRETYSTYAWPRALGVLYERNGLWVAIAAAGSLATCLLLMLTLMGGRVLEPLAGDFYAVIPHRLMVSMFGAVFAFAVLVIAIGARRFWCDLGAKENTLATLTEATTNVLALTYLSGGHGDGCNESDDRFTRARRRFHHLTFYGFMLCFASTVIGTLYHYVMGWTAPYPVVSLPVILGTVGGIGLLIGPAGLLWLNYRRHPDHGDPKQHPMDRGFIALLLLTSATGLALLIWRNSGAMTLLLAIHLGVVLALFVTLPYGKFVHGIYRSTALLKWAIERRQ